MAFTWDPDRYLRHADHRSRPFVELLARVGAENPATVVDLGCGPGHLMPVLADRWPRAHVLGVDSSPEMVAAAVERGVEAQVGDVRDWTADPAVDVLISNATLQWVPDHLALLPRLVDQVAPGGWFAFSVPANFDEPSHTLRDVLAADPRFAPHLGGIEVPSSHDAATYLAVLQDFGCEVDAWETTYLHVLTGEDPVFSWISGTGLRPTLLALPEEKRAEFEDEIKVRLRAAYPDLGHGAVMPFRRVFVVARRTD